MNKQEPPTTASWSALLASVECPYCPDKNMAEKGFRFCSQACAVRYRDSCFQCKKHPQGRVVSRRFCSQDCSDAYRRRESVPLALRPLCSHSAATCPNGTNCYNRHGVSVSSTPYQLVLIVSRNHVFRLKEYLKNEFVLSDRAKLRVLSNDLLPVASAPSKNKKRSTSGRLFVSIEAFTSSSSSSSSSFSSSSSSSSTSASANKKQKTTHASAPTTDLIQHAIEVLLADVNLFRVLVRVYAIDGAAATETELLHVMSRRLQQNNATLPTAAAPILFRPRCFPPELGTLLAHELVTDDHSIALTTKGQHRVLCAMNIDTGILYGSYVATESIQAAAVAKLIEKNGNSVHGLNSKPSASASKTTSATAIGSSGRTAHHRVSRAAWKLCEVYRRRPQFNPTCLKLGRPFVAIDIGASPGGWSYELASMPGCKKVYAVDPGDLTAPVPSNVVHLQQKIEDCTSDFKTQGVAFDCVVCDMNSSPRMTVESFLGLSDVLNDGAVIVLTFKNFVGGRKAFAKALKEALVLLEGKVLEQDVVQLFSGGVEERTLVGKWSCSR